MYQTFRGKSKPKALFLWGGKIVSHRDAVCELKIARWKSHVCLFFRKSSSRKVSKFKFLHCDFRASFTYWIAIWLPNFCPLKQWNLRFTISRFYGLFKIKMKYRFVTNVQNHKTRGTEEYWKVPLDFTLKEC